jgi:hypothetical protein
MRFDLRIPIDRKTLENMTHLDWEGRDAEFADRNTETSSIRLGS